MAIEGRPIVYACSMNQYGAARFCKFHFGSFFNRVEINQKTRMFDIYINEYVLTENDFPDDKLYYNTVFTQEMQDDFKSYWGNTVPGFKVVMVESFERIRG